jgi:hypothetical protein
MSDRAFMTIEEFELVVLNSDKVLPPLEKALMDVIIEWND